MSENNKYSTYEAKSKFSEVIKKAIAAGSSGVIVTSNGEPVVRIIPYKPEERTYAEIFKEWELQGKVNKVTSRDFTLKVSEKYGLKAKPGALQRFLDERD